MAKSKDERSIRDSIHWRLIMFKSYLKVTFRGIRRHKGYTFINVAGLAIGMAVCILIMLWVLDELSYDRYHENADRIYLLVIDANVGRPLRSPATMAPAAPTMVNDFPEVVNAARIGRLRRMAVAYEDNRFQEDLVGFADHSLFEIFTFPFISGDPASALKTAYSVVITEEMAQKYFGDEDPIGKILTIGGETEYTVTGVVKNVPRNSHLRFNMLRSFETLYAQNRQAMEAWMSIEFRTYLSLAENSDYKELEKKFPALIDQHLGEVLSSISGTVELFLEPVTRIHLFLEADFGISSQGDITYVYLFSGIALFVLVIACINFVNLATARSINRAQEVGMRKTLGAARCRLIGQFLGESLIYSMLSLVLTFVLLLLALPLFNTIVGRELSINVIRSPWLIPGFMGLALIVGLVAGSYPAFVLSSFQPVRVLKSGLKTEASNSRFRSMLVVVQFAISISLIIGTMTIYRQINFMKNRKLGFDKEHVIILPRMNEAMRRSFPLVKNDLMSVPGVVRVGGSSLLPGRGVLKGIFSPEGFPDDQPQTMDYLSIDHDFIPMMGMEIAAGRNFSGDLATDTSESVMINETTARQFGWDNPLDKSFIFRPPPGTEGETTIMNVIGVVKDFHRASLRETIEPLIIFYDPVSPGRISARIKPENITHTMDLLKKKWSDIDPGRPFDYYFLNETFDRLYRAEERLGNITLYFSLLAIFIGCLGLFGLAAFMAEKRTKEIGIRKVLGASVVGIVRLMSKEFMILVAIANVIAWPAAYYGLDRWMQNFVYRTNIAWMTFVLAGILALFIALLTVSFQAIKAARANPVDSIRYE